LIITGERIYQPRGRRKETSGTGRSPDEENLDLQTSRSGLLVDQIRDSVTDTKVPKPVGGDGEGHSLGTDIEWEDLAGDDPSDRTPCGGEEGVVGTYESDQNLLSSNVRGRDRNTDDGDQELANTHAGGTDQEQPSTTEPLDTPHTRESHEHVYDVGGDSDQEGVTDTRVLEERGTVVEDEIDTGELLPCLDEDASEGTKKDFVVRSAETVEVRRLAQIPLALEGNPDLGVQPGFRDVREGRRSDGRELGQHLRRALP